MSNLKILHLSITMFSVISLVLVLNYGIPLASAYVSPADLYKQSDVVLYGQVLAKDLHSSPGYLYYQVRPLQYIKGDQSYRTVTLTEKITDRPIVSFEAGDKILFFLNRTSSGVLMSPYSQKAGAACDIHSFLGPGLLPGEKMPISSTAAGSLRIFDTFGNVVSAAHQNQYLVFEFDNIWNNYPQARNITATIVVRLNNDTQAIFDQKQVIPILACDGPAKVRWNFVPHKTGNYSATLLFDKHVLEDNFGVMAQPEWGADPDIWWGASSLQLKVSKTDAFPGDTVNLIGRTMPNTMVKISLMKPNLTTEDLGSTSSDRLGRFHSVIKIPEDSESGIWRIISKDNSIAMSSPAITIEQEMQCCHAINGSILITPLQQFDYGIPSENVQCSTNLVLIIKSDDQSPSCVKPDTAQKLIERGWVKEATGYVTKQASVIQDTPTSICGQFYAAPDNPPNLRETPVILMGSNSTSCVRLTFTVVGSFKDCNGPHCSSLARLDSLVHIGNVNYEENNGVTSVTPARDFTNSFKINAVPEAVDLSNYSLGSTFSVTYVIKTLPGATGFYDSSIPKIACDVYPLAVGYAPNEVNASDFTYINSVALPCPRGLYQLTGIEISGMSYTEVKLP